jgi:hypothetical protein
MLSLLLSGRGSEICYGKIKNFLSTSNAVLGKKNETKNPKKFINGF